MRIIHFFVVVLMCSVILAGCQNSEPEGAYCKLVYSVLLPTERSKIDKWAEVQLNKGVLVQADKAVFWIDEESRVFALNKDGVKITDSQSGTAHATPELLRSVNRSLMAAGKRSIHTQGGWKYFQWNKRQ